MSIVLTPDLSKAARRELTLTQTNVIAETGIQAYKLKQFEAGRFRPDLASLKKLTDFYESQGIDFEKLEANATGTLPAVERETLAKRGLTAHAKPGFLISDDVDQERMDIVLERMEENDERVFELIAQEHTTNLFGGASDETEKAMRELFGRLAENHLLFRFLQGKGLVTEAKNKPSTIGDHLANWAKDSPLYDVLTLSGEASGLDNLEG